MVCRKVCPIFTVPRWTGMAAMERISALIRRITEGRAVSFRRDADWKTEMARVREMLRAEINRDTDSTAWTVWR